MSDPRLAITIGDAAGIGPEVILKALQAPLPAIPLLYGARRIFEQVDAQLTHTLPHYTPLRERMVTIHDPSDVLPAGAIGVLDVSPQLDLNGVTPGEGHPACATLQLEALRCAIEHARTAQVAAIVTAPWSKELFRLIDAPAVGHTEVLADAFDAPHHVMMLAGPRLRVALTTVHVPLARVSSQITYERLRDTILTTVKDLQRWFGIARPRLAVCGLNPHAGERGVMGDEEERVIIPALDALRAELAMRESGGGAGATLIGPLPSDTLFGKLHGAQTPYDAVICMYHDQGLIPLKLLHFGESANITLGLPILRTSVDHGTAYDIAGRGEADASSMRYALELALELLARQGDVA